jgi:hypothetical protein
VVALTILRDFDVEWLYFHGKSTRKGVSIYQIQLQLSDQLFDLATRRAGEAGFASLSEYIVDVVSDEISSDVENLSQRFTPEVIAHLEQIRDQTASGAKTYSHKEVDEYLTQKANAWRESHGN